MNKFLPNLLIVLALGLCGLVAYQWNREARLHADRQGLQNTLAKRDKTIQDLQAALKRIEQEVGRLDALKSELTGTTKTNRWEIDALRKSLSHAEKEGNTLREQLRIYQQAVDKQNENLKQQNGIITEQNARMQALAADRNATVEKFNKLAKEYNQLVKDYTELADRINARPASSGQPQGQ